MKKPSSPDRSGLPRCPFEPGEEKEARRLLSEGPVTVDLEVSKRDLRSAKPEIAGVFMWALALVVFPIVTLLKRGELPSIVEVGISSLGFALPFWALLRWILRSQGPLHASVNTAKIVLGGEELATFDELGVPRRARKILTREDHRGKELKDEWPVIVMPRTSGEDLVLFPESSTVSSKVLNRMDEIADHLNALLAEYHQRKAVERWLAEREAEQEQQRIYR